jgi:hypothetical protein
MLVIPAVRRLRQEDKELEVSLGYIVSSRPAWTQSQKQRIMEIFYRLDLQGPQSLKVPNHKEDLIMYGVHNYSYSRSYVIKF